MSCCEEKAAVFSSSSESPETGLRREEVAEALSCRRDTGTILPSHSPDWVRLTLLTFGQGQSDTSSNPSRLPKRQPGNSEANSSTGLEMLDGYEQPTQGAMAREKTQ